MTMISLPRVKTVKALDDYCLEIVFSDGKQGVFNVKPHLFGPLFLPLKDEQVFKQVRVDEFGAVMWPNQADLAPDMMYNNLQLHT